MIHRRKTLILGAGGREFHNFNLLYRADTHHRVLAFATGRQAPEIAVCYPPHLSGPLYPEGIPIRSMTELESLIEELDIADVVFSGSDISHAEVMHLASRVLAAGADFQLHAPERTMLTSSRPVIAITAVRSGAGKTPATRYVAAILAEAGYRVAVVRHPLPLSNLKRPIAQRFASVAELDSEECTFEEREEFEPLITAGVVVHIGLDYAAVLAEAEADADVLLWDGASNDQPFIRPDLHITITDALRPGEETEYHPGEVSVRTADVVLINKCNSASAEQIAQVEEAIRRLNPEATVLRADSPVRIDNAVAARGRTVVVVEEAQGVTLGAVRPGAGLIAAHQIGVSGILSPRPNATGSLIEVYHRYPHAQGVLPLMGYSAQQLAEVQSTLDATPCEAIVAATGIDLTRVLTITKPLAKAAFELCPHEPEVLAHLVIEGVRGGTA